MAPDAICAHPRLAPIYDAFDGERGDLVAYAGVVDELGAGTVVDVRCGTGSLAVLLAERGRTVVGVDPAEASLEVARGKDLTGLVRWVHGVAAVEASLIARGYRVQDVREAPDRPGREFVFIASRIG